MALAYLAGKLVAGIGPMVAAWRSDEPDLAGPDWLKAPFTLLPPRKELIKFGLSTNFSGTINKIVRDSELLWVGAFFNPLAAGYYRTAHRRDQPGHFADQPLYCHHLS